MVNNYNDFITESLVFKLLLEGNMVYSTKFIQILNTMNGVGKVKSMINDIIDSTNVSVDIKPNYIDVSDKSDTIKFIPDDKLDDKLLTYKKKSAFVLNKNNSLIYDIIRIGGIKSKDGLVDNLDFDNLEFEMINKFKIPGYGHLVFYYMKIIPDDEVDEDKYVILYGDTDPVVTANIPKSNRTSELKIGRFIKRFFDAYEGRSRFYTAEDIEKFVDEYTSTVLYMNNILDYFFVVDGEDIKYWYDEDNYEFSEKGQLGQSCMRYNYCADYFKVYINNPDKCKLLIFKSRNNNLLGRALLWVLDDNSIYMDRVYTSQNSYNILFKNWGIKNNYINQYPATNNISVTIKNEVYDSYPYMDTFDSIKFTTDPPSDRPITITNGDASGVNGELVSTVLYNYSPDGTFYKLESTNGYVSART